jgi:hypothetical protein
LTDDPTSWTSWHAGSRNDVGGSDLDTDSVAIEPGYTLVIITYWTSSGSKISDLEHKAMFNAYSTLLASCAANCLEPEPSNIANYSLLSGSTRIGSIRNVTCGPGYVGYKSNNIECLPNGEWNSSINNARGCYLQPVLYDPLEFYSNLTKVRVRTIVTYANEVWPQFNHIPPLLSDVAMDYDLHLDAWGNIIGGEYITINPEFAPAIPEGWPDFAWFNT